MMPSSSADVSFLANEKGAGKAFTAVLTGHELPALFAGEASDPVLDGFDIAF